MPDISACLSNTTKKNAAENYYETKRAVEERKKKEKSCIEIDTKLNIHIGAIVGRESDLYVKRFCFECSDSTHH